MTLYVITEGCYSDYHIVCIFTNKEKAENYVKYNTGYSEMYVEEYETEDEKYTLITNGYKTVTGEVAINAKNRVEDVRITDSRLTTNRQDSSQLISYPYKNEWELYFTRSFPEKALRYEDDEKYSLTQILSDTAGMAANLKAQGYTVDQARELLNLEPKES